MSSLTLEFTILGEPASITVEFGSDPDKPFAAMRLAYGDFRTAGLANVKHCLGDSFDPLMAHVLQERDLQTSFQ